MIKIVLAVAAVALAWGSASAQTYPDRPIRLIIGAPPGSLNDVVARLVTKHISERVGQPFIIDNRPGANYTIAANLVAKAKPDGYTLYFGPGQAPHPIFNKVNAVDTAKELAPISNIISGPFFFYINPKLPINSLQDLVAYTSAHPDKLNFGASSEVNELVMRVIKSKTGITYTSIPYKGTSPVVSALVAGEIDVTSTSLVGFLPNVRSGRIRALFAATSKRADVLPDVPTAAEFGIADFRIQFNSGLWAPPATPPAIIQKLNAEIVAALKITEVVDWFRESGLEAVSSTPEGQVRIHEEEMAFWAEAARLSNYQPQ